MELGTVDRNGIIRFSSKDNRDCHAFLQSRGLVADNKRGWWAKGKLGQITYWQGEWHAAISSHEAA